MVLTAREGLWNQKDCTHPSAAIASLHCVRCVLNGHLERCCLFVLDSGYCIDKWTNRAFFMPLYICLVDLQWHWKKEGIHRKDAIGFKSIQGDLLIKSD